ncbi:MAG: hypothetical protein MZV63_13620 [Marinilabiliales bacterium]|nr:hypothetical protein [Marinilabiliales bacterium]
MLRRRHRHLGGERRRAPENEQEEGRDDGRSSEDLHLASPIRGPVDAVPGYSPGSYLPATVTASPSA